MPPQGTDKRLCLETAHLQGCQIPLELGSSGTATHRLAADQAANSGLCYQAAKPFGNVPQQPLAAGPF